MSITSQEVVLIIGHQRAAGIGGEGLGGFEVAPGKGRLAGTGRADQDDEEN